MFWSQAPASIVTPDHGYVLLALVLTWFVHNGWMSSKVMKARKAHEVKYPDLYLVPSGDDDARARMYNCVQRGHHNSLENLPSFLALLLSASVFYPRESAIAALVYNVGVIRYFNGYATGDPKLRMKGAIKYLGLLYLLGANVRVAVQLLLGH